jgi:hypothetical protein
MGRVRRSFHGLHFKTPERGEARSERKATTAIAEFYDRQSPPSLEVVDAPFRQAELLG